MTVKIEELLDFIGKFSIEDKIYLFVQNEKNQEVCFFYERKFNNNKCWKCWYVINKNASLQNFSNSSLKNVMKEFEVNEKSLISELLDNLAIQTAYADEFVRQMENVMGAQFVQKSIFEAQNFMNTISDATKNLFEPNTSPTSKISTNKPILKVIKNS